MIKIKRIYLQMLLGETLSLVFGMSNLVIWAGIACPQIYKNYKNSSSKAVSYLLYYKLLMGGIISLSIAFIKHTSLTVKYVGIHHTAITIILMSQLLYYRFKPTYIRLSSDIENTMNYDEDQNVTLGLSKIEIIITIIFTPLIHTLLVIVFITRNVTLIEVLAWVANILFTTSKFTQIYINYSRKSTQGLSKFSFTCMIFTDLFFLASVFVNGIDQPLSGVIIKNIQWISSCSISLCCGFIILSQFSLYKNTNTHY